MDCDRFFVRHQIESVNGAIRIIMFFKIQPFPIPGFPSKHPTILGNLHQFAGLNMGFINLKLTCAIGSEIDPFPIV